MFLVHTARRDCQKVYDWSFCLKLVASSLACPFFALASLRSWRRCAARSLRFFAADDGDGHGRAGLFILRCGCDAGWHHRERHFPRLGFRVWHWLILLIIYVLLEVFVEFFDGECGFVGGYRVEALAATRLYCFG